MMSEHPQKNQAASQNHAQNQSTPKKLKCLRIKIQKIALKLIKIYKKKTLMSGNRPPCVEIQ